MIDIDEIERIAKAGDPWGYAATPANVIALISEVRALRETIKRQASAARMGMDAAKAGGAIMLELATQARAESSPDVLASERAMNAMLTEENEALREDAERYQWAIAYEDNAETLLAAVMSNAPDKAAISAEIDAERSKEKV